MPAPDCGAAGGAITITKCVYELLGEMFGTASKRDCGWRFKERCRFGGQIIVLAFATRPDMLKLMALPKELSARQFYRAAKQRFEDASVLLKAQRTTGAIYLAGYSVECMLKALILARTTKAKEFRGEKGHDYESLKALFFRTGGSFPRAVSQAFARVNTWKVSRRYETGTAKYRDAEVFLESVGVIMDWVERSI